MARWADSSAWQSTAFGKAGLLLGERKAGAAGQARCLGLREFNSRSVHPSSTGVSGLNDAAMPKTIAPTLLSTRAYTQARLPSWPYWVCSQFALRPICAILTKNEQMMTPVSAVTTRGVSPSAGLMMKLSAL